MFRVGGYPIIIESSVAGGVVKELKLFVVVVVEFFGGRGEGLVQMILSLYSDLCNI